MSDNNNTHSILVDEATLQKHIDEIVYEAGMRALSNFYDTNIRNACTCAVEDRRKTLERCRYILGQLELLESRKPGTHPA